MAIIELITEKGEEPVEFEIPDEIFDRVEKAADKNGVDVEVALSAIIEKGMDNARAEAAFYDVEPSQLMLGRVMDRNDEFDGDFFETLQTLKNDSDDDTSDTSGVDE